MCVCVCACACVCARACVCVRVCYRVGVRAKASFSAPTFERVYGPTLGNALLFRFSQLQLLCSTSICGLQASSPRSELSAERAATNVVDFCRTDQILSNFNIISTHQPITELVSLSLPVMLKFCRRRTSGPDQYMLGHGIFTLYGWINPNPSRWNPTPTRRSASLEQTSLVPKCLTTRMTMLQLDRFETISVPA